MITSWYQVMVFKQYWLCFECLLINHLTVAQASFNTRLKNFTYHIFLRTELNAQPSFVWGLAFSFHVYFSTILPPHLPLFEWECYVTAKALTKDDNMDALFGRSLTKSNSQLSTLTIYSYPDAFPYITPVKVPRLRAKFCLSKILEYAIMRLLGESAMKMMAPLLVWIGKG